MLQTTLKRWLEVTAWNKEYWSDVRQLANSLKADGCTGVADIFKWTCLEHDIHYRTHKLIYGQEIEKSEADYIFRIRIYQTPMSLVKYIVAWTRWLGVAVVFKSVSQKAWNTYGGTKTINPK